MFKYKVYFLIINHINISLSREVSEILGLLVVNTLFIPKGRCFLKAISLTNSDFDHPYLQMQYKGIQKSPDRFSSRLEFQPKHLFQSSVPFVLQVWDFILQPISSCSPPPGSF